MTKEKAIAMNYLYFLRANKVKTLALETEYPAGIYHIHMYSLADVIGFFEGLQGDELMRIMRVKDGLRLRPLTCNPRSATTKTRNPIMVDFVHGLKHVEVYAQNGRIKWRETEQLTRMEIGGKDISKLSNTKCDLKLLQGYDLTEVKAMSGMLSFGDKRDEALEWIVG